MDDFTPANELKKRFQVIGHFYDILARKERFRCRSILEINGGSQSELDFVVIMTNPGSSEPTDSNYRPEVITPTQIEEGEWKRELVPAVPDQTQYQIMRLMEKIGAKKVQVFNLCDLRNGKATSLECDYRRAFRCDPLASFSITHSSRLNVLKEKIALSVLKIPILGWGKNEFLRIYAERVLSEFPSHLGVALKKPWFSHPGPLRKEHKLRWLSIMLNQINQAQQGGI